MSDGDRALIRVSGALNVGAPPSDVDATLAEAQRFLNDEGRRAAAALWEKLQKGYAE